jgi:hypothetical protein
MFWMWSKGEYPRVKQRTEREGVLLRKLAAWFWRLQAGRISNAGMAVRSKQYI